MDGGPACSKRCFKLADHIFKARPGGSLLPLKGTQLLSESDTTKDAPAGTFPEPV